MKLKDIKEKLKDTINKFVPIFASEREQEQPANEGISLLKSYITLIDRTKEKNEAVIEKLDGYKDSFRKVLDSKRTTYSGDFDMGQIDYKKNLYNEVFLNIFEENKIDLFDKRKKPFGEELCSTLCMLARLSAYRADIEEAIEDARARLTALTELNTEKVFMRPSKRRSLNEAINGLESSYLLFANHLSAIKRVVIRIHRDYLYLSEDEEVKKAQNNLIGNKRRKLESIIETIGSKKLDFYRSINESLVAIAKMEQELYEYVYTHRDEVENINVQVDSLDVERIANVDEVMGQIAHYEMLYKVFSTYGRNLVKDEDLTALYDKKFTVKIEKMFDYLDKKIVLLNGMFVDGATFDEATFLEIECYEKCVLKNLERLMSDDKLAEEMSPSIKNLIGIEGALENMRKSLKGIFEIEQHEEDEEKTWRILNDTKLLIFLFSFKRENGLKKFFGNFLVATSAIQDVDLQTEFYNWEAAIPLESLYTMKSWNKIAGLDGKTSDSWYEFFRLYKAYINPDNRLFPEGITTINFDYMRRRMALSYSILSDSSKYAKMLERAMSIQTVRLPSSLKSIRGPLFAELKDLDIVLNENLCEIDERIFEESEIVSLTIPSNLEKNLPYGFAYFASLLNKSTVDTVCLTDYDAEKGISPTFIKGFFKARIDKSSNAKHKVIGDSEYLLSKRAVPKFETLIICCGTTRIKVEVDNLRYAFKSIVVGDTSQSEKEIRTDDARRIASLLTHQIAKELEMNDSIQSELTSSRSEGKNSSTHHV